MLGLHIPRGVDTEIPQEGVLYGECREELKGILRQLLEMKKVEIVEGVICKGHILLRVRIPPE